MPKTTDYSKMRMHRQVRNGRRIETCPKCGRKGMRSDFAPKRTRDTASQFHTSGRCIHSETDKGIVLGVFREMSEEACWFKIPCEGLELEELREKRRAGLEANVTHARKNLAAFDAEVAAEA